MKCVHFVGFKGEEFNSAVKVFGRPHFIHRWNDNRLKFGGEIAEDDLIIFANGEEMKDRPFTFNDSEHL